MEYVIEVGDDLRADHAVKLARQDAILLWRGDFRNAVQLLAAMKRRLSRVRPGSGPADTFRRYREATARRARLLGRVRVELGPGHTLALPHAPDVAEACEQAFGSADQPSVMPLTDILGALGAHRWRVRGVEVPVLGQKIHPHYGVFAPTRQEYLDLVAQAPWPRPDAAFDIGTGTGVLAALLAQRGAKHVVAVDIEPRAVACARDNLQRMGLKIPVYRQDLFPHGRADLVVCNPPWLPGRPASTLDAAVYDPDSRMLRGFLRDLRGHLSEHGEAWLVLSDLAVRLGLRKPTEELIEAAGLTVAGRLDSEPRHGKARRTDPLAEYRAAETTSLWRLRA